ncbi:MAG: isoprenylcysteine carboxylmethyltransferase family protein [Candidatus Sumerlaeota bacterium]|nr:isoprenylcysteine carboxylmethyltransferase family protein [Candidatus Sumerlaeota bacterium]
MRREKYHIVSRGYLRNLLVVVALFLSRPTAPYLIAGAIVFVFGMALRIWSKGTLQRDEALTVDGPYALCRHPFYLANLLVDSGICLMTGQPLLLLAYVPFFYSVYLPVMRREEAFLSERFPRECAQCGRRMRLFPLPPREWRMLRGSWSAHRAFIYEREATRSLRLLAIPLVVVAAGQAWRDGWCEFIEWDGLYLLCAAAALNLIGHLLYRHLVRSGKRHRLSSRWAAGGLALVFVFSLAMTFSAPWEASELPALARQLGAAPVLALQDLPQLQGAPAAGLYLVEDDVYHEKLASASPGVRMIRPYWKDFEVYYLVRIGTP